MKLYGMPWVIRKDYVIINRHKLKYLNFSKKFNCVYCGYFTGVIYYAQEIAGRTERYWCPIKHSTILKNSHNEALDKARWQSAVKEAQNRGLDRSEKNETVKELRQHNFRKARRHPVKHAQVLLNETSLSFFEIAQITGLNVYQVVTIKLQLREAA